MCYAIYIGVSNQLKFIDDVDKTLLSINLMIEAAINKNILKKFTKPYIYFVSSYEGCSCGFDILDVDEKDDDYTTMLASTNELINFLKTVAIVQNVEFYCFWQGEDIEEIEERKTIKTSDISIKNYFGLRDKLFINFTQQ